jgi:lipid A 4'-phosphatase
LLRYSLKEQQDLKKFRSLKSKIFFISAAFFWLLFSVFSKKIDLFTTQYFTPGSPFIFDVAEFFSSIGEYPGYIAFGLAILLFLFSDKLQLSKNHLYYLKTFLCVWIVGNILIVNVFLKTIGGRPRPRFVSELGGDEPMRGYYQWQLKPITTKFRSFPSGHTSVASSLLTIPISLHVRRRYREFILLGIPTVIFTCIVAWSRIALKAHFLSDVLFSFLFMICLSYLVAYNLNNCFEKNKVSNKNFH